MAFGVSENAANSNEEIRRVPAPCDLVISRWRLLLNVAPGAGTSYTYTVRVGDSDGSQADTAMAITISGTDTYGYYSGSITVLKGQTISISAVPSSSPATINGNDMLFDVYPSIPGTSVMFGAQFNLSGTGTQYFGPQALCEVSTTETDVFGIIPTPGKIFNLFFRHGTVMSSDTMTITSRINQASKSLTVTLNDTEIQGSDETNDFDVVATDEINFMKTATGTPPSNQGMFSYCFKPDTPGYNIKLKHGTTAASVAAAVASLEGSNDWINGEANKEYEHHTTIGIVTGKQ